MENQESQSGPKVRSLEMAELGDLFDSDQLPITTEALIEQYGDCEVSYQRGTERLGSVLRTSGAETYRTVTEIRLAVLNGVSRDAVGRPRYSDRNDEHTEEFERMQRSF